MQLGWRPPPGHGAAPGDRAHAARSRCDVNTLRQIMVAIAAVAAVIAASYGRWLTVVVLSAAVVVHGYLTWRLAQERRDGSGVRPAGHAAGIAGAPRDQQH